MRSKSRYVPLLVFAILANLVAAFALYPRIFRGRDVLIQRAMGKYTVAQRLDQFGPEVKARWKPFFEQDRISYPPAKLAFITFKAEKLLDIYAAGEDEKWKFVRRLPILGASGKMGPKLREGDLQVPEGFYKIESLNPNSAFHLALRVSYPSKEDQEIAAREGRNELGSDIMIHGGTGSVGCLAMGDEVAEDLFVLAAQTGRENIEIVICPLDFRTASVPADPSRPNWVKSRYTRLEKFIQTLPRESS